MFKEPADDEEGLVFCVKILKIHIPEERSQRIKKTFFVSPYGSLSFCHGDSFAQGQVNVLYPIMFCGDLVFKTS